MGVGRIKLEGERADGGRFLKRCDGRTPAGQVPMRVGVPSEIETNENRGALVPAGAEFGRAAAALRPGLTIVAGKVVYPAVAEAFGLTLAAPESVL